MSKKKLIVIRVIIILLILGWMNLVFGFSAQNSAESSNLSLTIASWFSNDINTQQFLEPYIRKIAHFSEYAVGGMLFFSLFSTFNIKERKRILFACFLGIIYATTDEIHQLFVDGRSGQVIDVCIDSLGVITGVLLLKLLIMIYKNIMKLKQEKI